MSKQARSLAAVFSFALLANLASPLYAATYKIKWFLGHKNLDYFEEAALNFKKTVETGSKGDISIDIVMQADDDPSRNSTQTPQIAAMVAKGEIEMGHSFVDVMGSIDPRLYAFEAPYLFRGYRHMEGVFEGPIGLELLEGLRAHGLVGLSFTYSGGANGVATIDRQIRRPEDMQGLKIGVFGNEINAAWLRSLGATPVPIEHSLESILPAAKNDTLDAVVITWRNLAQQGINTDFRQMNLVNSTYLVSITYINEKFFSKLPEKYQTLISEASREAGRIERAKTIMLNQDAKLEMLGKGVRSVYLTQENLRRFVRRLQPAYTNSIEKIIGKDLLERIRSTNDSSPHPSTLAKR